MLNNTEIIDEEDTDTDAAAAVTVAATTSSIVSTQAQRLHPTGRIRSHSLKPRHSKQDYARRKSAADASPIVINKNSRLELSTDNTRHERANTPPPRRASATWAQRRFTLYPLEQDELNVSQHRRMTTGRFSIFEAKSNRHFLKQKRPSIISQVVESFARRFSIRKKKTNDSEQDEPIIDPVYETLKVAAETRKKTLATYLNHRQQSLNSQGSSELDIPSSPKVSRHASRTEAEITSSLRPPLPPSSNQQNSASSQDNARITNC